MYSVSNFSIHGMITTLPSVIYDKCAETSRTRNYMFRTTRKHYDSFLLKKCQLKNSIYHMHVKKKMAPAGNECYNVFFFDGFYI